MKTPNTSANEAKQPPSAGCHDAPCSPSDTPETDAREKYGVVSAEFARSLERERNKLASKFTKLDKPKYSGEPMLDSVLAEENPDFRAWVKSLPDTYWARYDLSAARIGWEAACKFILENAQDEGQPEKGAMFPDVPLHRLVRLCRRHKPSGRDFRLIPQRVCWSGDTIDVCSVCGMDVYDSEWPKHHSEELLEMVEPNREL